MQKITHAAILPMQLHSSLYMIWDKLTTQGIKLASFPSASALCEQSGFMWQLQETSALLYSLLAANATVQIY